MGKLGRDYFHQLHDLDAFDIDVFVSDHKDTLLGTLQKDIFELHDRTAKSQKTVMQNDQSLQFHSCHSPLREVEILYDHLLNMFEQNPELTPKRHCYYAAGYRQLHPLDSSRIWQRG